MADLTRRAFSQSVAGGALAAASSSAATGSKAVRRPNILVMFSDQHAHSVMGCSGHPVVKTPNLDRLAEMGVRFSNAYCNSPVCTPSRASFITGMYPSDVDSYCNSTPFEGQMPTWGARLRDKGYHTWATGKMDLWPNRDLGFEEVKTSHGHASSPDITSLFRRPLCYRVNERHQADGAWRTERHDDHEKTQRALGYLRGREKGTPWACYVGWTMPHPRFLALEKYRQVYPTYNVPMPNIPPGHLERRHQAYESMAHFKRIAVPVPEERVRAARAAYYGMVSELDEYAGLLLDEIERRGELDNTLIIYTSDHGEMLGDHGLWLKNVLLEGAAHVPLIVAGTGLPQGKVVDTTVSLVDLIRTIGELGEADGTDRLRGHSLLPLLEGGEGHPGWAYAESHSEGNPTGSFMIRKGDWKYIYFTGFENLLFNLKDDPGEMNNLAGKPAFASIERELHGLLRSQVDPDEVTAKAFAAQRKKLQSIVEANDAEGFFRVMKGRLGEGQAAVLAQRHYGRWVTA